MASLVLLVGHLWTCSRGGSVYTEVSVFTTAAHTWFTCTLIWTWSRSDSSSSCRAIWGQAGAGQLLPLAECEFFNYINFLPVPSSWTLCRGPWVRELRCHVHPSVAAGRDGPLPVQRLRTLPQDERPEPAPHQAQTETGEFHPCSSTRRAGLQLWAQSRWRQHNSRKVIFSLWSSWNCLSLSPPDDPPSWPVTILLLLPLFLRSLLLLLLILLLIPESRLLHFTPCWRR